MSHHKEDLYDAFGELFYAICQVDGEVQEAELQQIAQLLQDQAGAAEIHWSFKYEYNKRPTVEEAYRKAIDICQQYGPAPEYDFVFAALEKLAAAANGLSEEERALIQRFKSELLAYFQKNISFDEE